MREISTGFVFDVLNLIKVLRKIEALLTCQVPNRALDALPVCLTFATNAKPPTANFGSAPLLALRLLASRSCWGDFNKAFLCIYGYVKCANIDVSSSPKTLRMVNNLTAVYATNVESIAPRVYEHLPQAP